MKQQYKIIRNAIFLALIVVFIMWLFGFLDISITTKAIFEREDEIKDNFSDIEEFHFTHMPLTYKIDVDTTPTTNDAYEVERIIWALQIIENSTDNLIQFKKADFNETPDIIIYGRPPLESEDKDRFIIEGLASPNETKENRIINADITLYAGETFLWAGGSHLEVIGGNLWEVTEYDPRESTSWEVDDCEHFPNTEVHEILHALGIGHNYNDSHSIMFPIDYPIQSCKTEEIDKEISSCLKHIYSNGKIGGDCSNLEMYPWPEEKEIGDFKWENLPITYSIFDCNDRQKRNLQMAEGVIKKYLGYNAYEFVENRKSDVNFYCHDSFDDVLLNEETDFWDTGVYFPASQPYFYFDKEENIQEVKILLFAQNRTCGGIEVHELLHGVGLREHYGHWMEYETEMCDLNTLVIGKEAIEKIKEIYSLG